MAIIPFYGEAVHAVLPFLKKQPHLIHEPQSLEKTFVQILRHAGFKGNSILDIIKVPGSIERILHNWHSVAEIMQSYPNVWIEPSIKLVTDEHESIIVTPDIIMCRMRKVVIVDIKTRSKNNQSWSKLKYQTLTSHAAIQKHFGNAFDVTAYGLVFKNDTEALPEPLWKPVELPKSSI